MRMRLGTVIAMCTVVVILAAFSLLASCNDSSEPDYSALMGGGQPANQASTRGNTSPPESGEASQINLPGAEEEPAEEEEEAEPVVIVLLEDTWTDANDIVKQMLIVEPPYYEAEDAGRYNIKVSVLVDEVTTAQVYRIVAIGKDGQEVGSQERHLVLPMKKPRSFDLNNFYCTSIPVAIAFYETEKDPATSEDSATTGSGAGRGQSGSGGNSVSRGAAGDTSGDDEETE